MLHISKTITVPETEIEMHAVRSQGAGGQNVNKVASAIHLRFDIQNSSLPEAVKQRLLQMGDQRITRDGTVIIKAQSHRSQDKNRQEALDRLRELIKSALAVRKKRKPTKPSLAARQRRIENKKQRSRLKNLRGKVEP